MYNFKSLIWRENYMAVQPESLKNAADFVLWLGLGGLIAMSIVGYIAFFVLLACLNEGKHDHCHGCFYPFLFISSPYPDPLGIVGFIFIGLLVTAFAVAIAMYAGLPMVALGLGAGWAGATTLVGLGLLLHHVAQSIERPNPSSSVTTVGTFRPPVRATHVIVVESAQPVVAIPIL